MYCSEEFIENDLLVEDQDRHNGIILSRLAEQWVQLQSTLTF